MTQSHRTPGFTAEIALGRGSRPYSSRHKGGHATPQVVPQFSRLGRPTGECIPGCICVSPFGCPCCKSILEPFPLPTTIEDALGPFGLT